MKIGYFYILKNMLKKLAKINHNKYNQKRPLTIHAYSSLYQTIYTFHQMTQCWLIIQWLPWLIIVVWSRMIKNRLADYGSNESNESRKGFFTENNFLRKYMFSSKTKTLRKLHHIKYYITCVNSQVSIFSKTLASIHSNKFQEINFEK